jgi:hypothetical protein
MQFSLLWGAPPATGSIDAHSSVAYTLSLRCRLSSSCLASSEFVCGRKAADKLGFPQVTGALAVQTGENFHEDPIVVASSI